MAHLAWLWWAITGGLLIAELLTGTFYLLMIALGFAAGAVTLNLGWQNGWQFVVGALVALLGLLSLYASRRRQRQAAARLDGTGAEGGAPTRPPGSDVNLDIGQQVRVDSWHGHRARVNYRGAFWDVEAAHTGILSGHSAEPGAQADAVLPAGWYRIEAVRGIVLIVSPEPISRLAPDSPDRTDAASGD